jgi:hypothetical protein
MSWTTIDGLMDLLVALPVAGVKRTAKHAPDSLDTGAMPCAYVRLPTEAASSTVSFTGTLGLHRVTLDYVIVAGPLNQGSAASNGARITALLDALRTALAGAAGDLALESYTMRAVEGDSGGGTLYYLVVCTLTCVGD